MSIVVVSAMAAAAFLAPAAAADPTRCFAKSGPSPTVRIVEPRDAAPVTSGKLWILLDVTPSGENIRSSLLFTATAEPTDKTVKPEPLAVDSPLRISSRLIDAQAGTSEPHALWVLPIGRPRVPATVFVRYTVRAFGRDPNGRPCELIGPSVVFGSVQFSGSPWPG